jgi:polyisoprenoid-binding protein YceI
LYPAGAQHAQIFKYTWLAFSALVCTFGCINPLSMKKIVFAFALIALFVLSAFTVSTPPDWQLTDGYSIRFKGKKANGFFHKLKGKVSFDENNLSASSCKLEIDASSVSFNNSLKTWHSKKRKWFDVKKYPTITFTSSKFQKTQKGYSVTGKLNMKGVEKEISVPFSFSNKIFFGSFYVKRTDYNVGTGKGLNKMVSDTMWIDFTIPVTM